MKKPFIIFYSFLLILSFPVCAQNNLIEKLLNDNKSLFDNILAKPDSFEVQIIYTQIDRNKNNFPSFTTIKYRVEPKDYFYPASLVKLPVAVLALEKMNLLAAPKESFGQAARYLVVPECFYRASTNRFPLKTCGNDAASGGEFNPKRLNIWINE